MTKSSISGKRGFWNRKTRRSIFIVLMLAYPIAHFLFFWVFINFSSIQLTFQKLITVGDDLELAKTYYGFVGWENYAALFERFAVNRRMRAMLLNSLSYAGLSLFIVLPLSILASFVLFKKLPLNGFIRVMFFLPSIIPLAALTIAYTAMFTPTIGPATRFLNMFGLAREGMFYSAQSSQVMIWLFCVWSGMGYNIILLSSAMARLPMEVLESGKLEGVKGMRELVQIYIPLIWPNITTMVVLGLMGTFNVAMQPMMLSGNINNTIGLEIFSVSSGNTNLEYAATLGMVCTVFAAPIVLLIRFVMERCFKDVSF